MSPLLAWVRRVNVIAVLLSVQLVGCVAGSPWLVDAIFCSVSDDPVLEFASGAFIWTGLISVFLGLLVGLSGARRGTMTVLYVISLAAYVAALAAKVYFQNQYTCDGT